MVVWPENKGPLAGKCPECRVGNVVLWYSDRIFRVYKCVECGMIFDRKGYVKKVDRGVAKRVVDEVFEELGLEVVSQRAFVETVDRVCCEKYGGGLPVIDRGEFEKWGYLVRDGLIRRRVVR